MALQAKLILEQQSKFYDVKDLDYELYKPHSNNYKPSAYPEGGLVNFTILSPMDKNLVFHEWLLKVPSIMKNGKFLLPLSHGTRHIVKELAFEKAHCVRLSESYSNYDSSQMHLRVTISAAKLIFSETLEYSNQDLP